MLLSAKTVRSGIAFASFVFLTIGILGSSAMGASSPLGSAQSFAILGATTVTNATTPPGVTMVTGNVGVSSPGVAVTGFPPGQVTGGAIHIGDAVANQAHSDAAAAYAAVVNLACPTANNLSGQDLGLGRTLATGVYCFNSSAFLTGQLNLAGPGPWVFQIGSTLITASNSSVVVLAGGQNCKGSNVFWQVGSSATLGTNTQFVGNILAFASITLTTGTSISGSALAIGAAVTMDTNHVSVCTGTGVILPPPGKGQTDEFTVNPFQFDPSNTHLVTAAWLGGLGCPTSTVVAAFAPPAFTTITVMPYQDATCPTGDPKDNKNEGLLLAKTGPTNNNASADATINGVRDDVLTEVGFDIRNGTHCGAGAPRFNIVVEGSSTIHFVGCAAMTTTSVGLYGQRKRATAAQMAASTAFPPIPPGSKIQSITIIFDEGQDTPTPSELGNGLAVIDNIDINGTLVGRGAQSDTNNEGGNNEDGNKEGGNNEGGNSDHGDNDH